MCVKIWMTRILSHTGAMFRTILHSCTAPFILPVGDLRKLIHTLLNRVVTITNICLFVWPAQEEKHDVTCNSERLCKRLRLIAETVATLSRSVITFMLVTFLAEASSSQIPLGFAYGQVQRHFLRVHKNYGFDTHVGVWHLQLAYSICLFFSYFAFQASFLAVGIELAVSLFRPNKAGSPFFNRSNALCGWSVANLVGSKQYTSKYKTDQMFIGQQAFFSARELFHCLRFSLPRCECIQAVQANI